MVNVWAQFITHIYTINNYCSISVAREITMWTSHVNKGNLVPGDKYARFGIITNWSGQQWHASGQVIMDQSFQNLDYYTRNLVFFTKLDHARLGTYQKNYSQY